MPSTKYWYLTNDAWATFATEKYECRPASKKERGNHDGNGDRYHGLGCMNDVTAGSICARFYQPSEHYRMRMPARKQEDVCLKDRQWCQARLSADNREEKGMIRGDGDC